MNPVTKYYVDQAGSGIPGFRGIRYQKGDGFWGDIWTRVGLPVLKFLGRTAANSGLNVAADALEGKNVKDSLISNLKAGGKGTVNYMQDLLAQQGKGIKRRKRLSSKSELTKRCRTTKSKSVKRQTSKKKPRKSTKKRRANSFNFDF